MFLMKLPICFHHTRGQCLITSNWVRFSKGSSMPMKNSPWIFRVKLAATLNFLPGFKTFSPWGQQPRCLVGTQMFSTGNQHAYNRSIRYPTTLLTKGPLQCLLLLLSPLLDSSSQYLQQQFAATDNNKISAWGPSSTEEPLSVREGGVSDSPSRKKGRGWQM